MDSIIPLRQKNTLAEYMILSSVDNRPPMLDKDLQKNTLAEYMILSSVDNRPPMLDKDLYDSSRMELYIQNREHGRMIIKSVENGPLIWPTVEENMERVQLLMQGTSLTKQERECKLYDAFDKFTYIKEESLHKYYLRFTKLINDMDIYNKKMKQSQVNTKFLNNLPPEWRDDPIDCLSKAMAFLTAVTSSRFSSINNQLRTSSNPRNQDTIQDGRVTVQQVQGRHGQSYFGTGYKSNATNFEGNNTSGRARVVKCYNCQGEGHMARQCTQPKRPRNAAWYKDKAMLTEAQEAGQILDEEKLAFLADPGVLDGQSIQAIIPNNAAFQTEDLDTYDFDCDDVLNAKAVLMANISNYGSDIISEHALKEQVDLLEQNLSNQIKEKKCLLQTFTVFKSEAKQKEEKYMENEIDLEKKIKKLDNIILKCVNHTVHMLTKPQAFYDNIHKQALGYQNPFYLKKAQRIKPTLYDGIVISNKHVAMPMIDDDETLILKEVSR
nr:hypothetical protein [Tanacetum cinerariifolium]